jgi:hypothetical protein
MSTPGLKMFCSSKLPPMSCHSPPTGDSSSREHGQQQVLGLQPELVRIQAVAASHVRRGWVQGQADLCLAQSCHGRMLLSASLNNEQREGGPRLPSGKEGVERVIGQGGPHFLYGLVVVGGCHTARTVKCRWMAWLSAQLQCTELQIMERSNNSGKRF